MRKIRITIKSILWMMLIFVGLSCGAAHAASGCTVMGMAGDSTITIPNMTVSRDTAIGQVIGTTRSTPPILQVSCTNYIPPLTVSEIAARDIARATSTMSVLDSAGVAIPGLGVKISNTYCTGVVAQRSTRCSGTGSVNDDPIGVPVSYPAIFLEFIKTANTLSAATLGSGNVFRMSIPSMPNTTQTYSIGNSATITANVCRFTIPVAVPLGSLTRASIATGTPGPTTSFRLEIDCDAGTQAKVRFDVTGSSTTEASSGLINNAAPTDPAANVQVQLLDSAGNAVALNVDRNYAATLTYPATLTYGARMRQKPGSVAGVGQVRASAVVTFTFF